MDSFFYLAKDKSGKSQKGEILASSREEAIRLLQAQGLYVLSVAKITGASKKEKTPAPSPGKEEHYTARRAFSHSGIKLEDLAVFARQLSTLLASGVPLLRSLEVVSSQCASRSLARVLAGLVRDIKGGLSLTDSIAKYPRVFSNLWRGLIDTGEASGNLSQVLDKLASYLELRQEFLRRLISAIIYPLILLVGGVLALLVFTLIILPKFQAIFSQFHVQLPFLTRLIFNLVDFIRFRVLLFLGVAVVLGVILKLFLGSSQGKEFFDHLILKLPLLKDFFSTFFLERFSSTASILFEGGMPVVYALDVIERSIGNVVFERTVKRIKENVKAGKSLSSQLAREGLFPPMVIEMAAVGEEVGNFPEMFAKVSQYYQTALTTKVERLTSLFEPMMILFMGAAIGVIVVALFMPLFQLASAVK